MTSGLFRPQDERFRADVRRFVDDSLRPQAAALEKAQVFPRRAIALCARQGYLSTDPHKNAVLAEEMPRCESSGLALSLFVQSTLVAPIIERLGTAAQRRRFLRRSFARPDSARWPLPSRLPARTWPRSKRAPWNNAARSS